MQRVGCNRRCQTTLLFSLSLALAYCIVYCNFGKQIEEKSTSCNHKGRNGTRKARTTLPTSSPSLPHDHPQSVLGNLSLSRKRTTTKPRTIDLQIAVPTKSTFGHPEWSSPNKKNGTRIGMARARKDLRVPPTSDDHIMRDLLRLI